MPVEHFCPHLRLLLFDCFCHPIRARPIQSDPVFCEPQCVSQTTHSLSRATANPLEINDSRSGANRATNLSDWGTSIGGYHGKLYATSPRQQLTAASCAEESKKQNITFEREGPLWRGPAGRYGHVGSFPAHHQRLLKGIVQAG